MLPPLAKFPGDFGIVELKEGGVLPVTLRNVEAKLPLANLQMPSAGAHRFSDQRLTDDAEVIAAIKALAKFEQQTRTVKIERDGEENSTMSIRFMPASFPSSRAEPTRPVINAAQARRDCRV